MPLLDNLLYRGHGINFHIYRNLFLPTTLSILPDALWKFVLNLESETDA